MSDKSSTSKAESYVEIGAFWDEHDATEFGEQTEVDFEVDLKSQARYYPINNQFTQKLKHLAEQRGISEVTLINLWIQEKIEQANTNKVA